MQPGEPYYEILRCVDRRRREARRDDAAGDARSRSLPINPIVQRIGGRQQLRVLATYADGEVRDVTREAFLESGNMRGRRGRPRRPDHRPAPRRGADPRPLRGRLRRDDADRDGRPHRLRLGPAAGLRTRSTNWSPPSGSG